MILQPETNSVQIQNSVDVHVPLNESGSYLISFFLNIEKYTLWSVFDGYS